MDILTKRTMASPSPIRISPIEFAELRIFEKFVDRIGNGQREPLPAVQEAAPKKIILEECKLGPQNRPPDCGPFALGKGLPGAKRGVAVDLPEDRAETALRPMFDRNIEQFHGPVDGDGFMDGRLRQAAPPFLEEPDHVIRPPSGVPNPAVLKKILSWKAVTGGNKVGAGNDLFDRVGRFGRDTLIGVQDEDPILTALIDRKLLLWTETTPRLVENITAEIGRDPLRPIRTPGIHKDDLTGKCNAPQTTGQVLLFIARNDRDGDRTFLFHGIHSIRVS